MLNKRRWFSFVKTFFVASNSGSLDSIDDGGALRWYLDISLVAAEEHC